MNASAAIASVILLEQKSALVVALGTLALRPPRTGRERGMETIKVRLRLAGRRSYEQPVSLFGNQPPKTGDLIDVPHNGHSVRAQVTSTSSPICREGDLVTYLVYAHELENQEGRGGGGERPPGTPLAAV